MFRRMENKGTYVVESSSGKLYMVTLTRLKNNGYCNLRYEVSVIELPAPLWMLGKEQEVSVQYIATYVYRFDGHYMNELDECHWIVNEHERRLNG